MAPLLGSKATITTLDYGDAAFSGNGPSGIIQIGIEVKNVLDALNSLVSGRFTGHQLPGLLRIYDRAWLVVEGWYRAEPVTGILQTISGHANGNRYGGQWRDASSGASRFTYRQFSGWLTTLEVEAGIRIRCTGSPADTAGFIESLYHWWQKPFTDHQSLHSFHEDRPDAALLTKPSLRRRIAAQLPGVGWQRSKDAAGHFANTRAMVMANANEWERVEGIGKGTAAKVVAAMESE